MKKIIAIVLVAVLFVGIMLTSCSAEKSIIGTWKSQNSIAGIVTETTYVFNEDGTGTRKTVLDIKFTYEFVEDKLNITTETLGVEFVEEYTYDFSSSNTLTLTDEKGTITLNKVD